MPKVRSSARRHARRPDVDGSTQLRVAEAIRQAFAVAGVTVHRQDRAGGNVDRLEPVSAESIVGELVARKGWIFKVEKPREAKVLPFELVKDDPK